MRFKLSLVLLLFAATQVTSQVIKTPEWSVPTTGDTGWDSPAIGPDGTIYIGDISGWLWAVNPDGTVKWNVAIGTNLSGGSPTFTNDGATIYISESTSPGKMFSINAADGIINWEWTLPAPAHITSTPEPGQQIGGGINSTAAISYDQNTLYFGTGNWLECNPCSEDIFDDRLIALDVSTNPPTLKWELKGLQEDAQVNESRVSFWAAPSIAPDGSIYAGNFNGILYHIQDNGSTFQILQKKDLLADMPLANKPMTDGYPAEVAEIWSNAAIDDDGTVFLQSNNGIGWALNADLTEKWSFPFLHNDTLYDNFLAPALTPNGLVIMAAENGYIYGLDKTNGAEVWKYPNTPTPPEEWWRFASVNQDGICILGSEKSGKYFAIDVNTGLYAWETDEIGLETGSCPAIAPDGTIYVTGGYDGGLFAFAGTSPLANTAWPKGFHNNGNYCRLDNAASSINNQNNHKIMVYPNPVKAGDVLQVELPEAFTGAVKLVDMQGRVVFFNNLSRYSSNYTIPLDDALNAGVYILKLGTNHQKIIVE